MLSRLTIWAVTAALTFGADVITKALPHTPRAEHYAHVPVLMLFLVGVFLVALGVRYSATLAFGSGLMFGGLCGNGGELLLFGYASDWIPFEGWLTNVADIADAVGLVCCCAGYVRIIQRRATHIRKEADT